MSRMILSLYGVIFIFLLILFILYYGEGLNIISTYNSLSSYDEWLTKQNELKYTMWKTCKKYNITVADKYQNPSSRYRKTSEPFYYCANHKVRIRESELKVSKVITQAGSTTLDSLFHDENKIGHKGIISAYNDKIKGNHKIVATEVVGTYGVNVTFPQFIEFIITQSKTKCSESTVKCTLNAHWKPFWRSHCNFCRVYYHVVGKLETWNQDMRHAVKIGKLGLSPKKYLTQKNPSKKSCSNCRMEDYFKDVDPKMLSELKELYRVDFEMFGYDFKV